MPGSTVRDGGWLPRDPAADGGDVAGASQVPVPSEVTVGTAEDPAGRLGNRLPALWAGRGCSPFVHQLDLDAGKFGLVLERVK
jgi:hypothetical protein